MGKLVEVSRYQVELFLGRLESYLPSNNTVLGNSPVLWSCEQGEVGVGVRGRGVDMRM